MNEGQENWCAFWEQAAAQVDLLPALSCVISITMGRQFKLLQSEMGLLICEGAGEYSCMNVQRTARESFWGLLSLCDSHESSSWYQVG